MRSILYLPIAALLAAVVVTSLAPTPVQAARACGEVNPESRNGVPLAESSRRILELLVQSDQGAGRVQALKAYLQQPEPEKIEPSDFVLRNYARMLVGANYIREQQYGLARKLLARVRLDSPAGVETALLTAWSYQQQGRTEAALDWYMRVSARYRASPEVLEALLERAEEAASSGQEQLATRLYERVVSKSLANLEDLARLARGSEDISAVILDRQSARDSSATVSGQLIRELLRGSTPQALPHLEHVLDARRELRCLETELEALKQEMFQASERQTQSGNFRTMLEREKGMLERRVGQLENRLQVADEHRRAKLERELTDSREKLDSLERKLAEVTRESGEARTLKQRKRELTRRRQELREYRDEHRAAVRREMEQLVVRLKKRYLDLAGEGQLGRASLFRNLAMNHSR